MIFARDSRDTMANVLQNQPIYILHTYKLCNVTQRRKLKLNWIPNALLSYSENKKNGTERRLS